MDRSALIAKIAERLGERRLVWFGTRCEDAEAAGDIPQFDAAFGLIGPLRRRASVESLALEQLTGVRMDLDTFDLDDHLRDEAVTEVRETMLRYLSRPAALFTYRPTMFLSAIA